MEHKMGFNEFFKLIKEMPPVEGYDCVEFVRKTRDKHYKEENGIPCVEETEYLEKWKRICDEQYYAFLESKGIKNLTLA